MVILDGFSPVLWRGSCSKFTDPLSCCLGGWPLVAPGFEASLAGLGSGAVSLFLLLFFLLVPLVSRPFSAGALCSFSCNEFCSFVSKKKKKKKKLPLVSKKTKEKKDIMIFLKFGGESGQISSNSHKPGFRNIVLDTDTKPRRQGGGYIT
jgi:hypothetical protein